MGKHSFLFWGFLLCSWMRGTCAGKMCLVACLTCCCKQRLTFRGELSSALEFGAFSTRFYNQESVSQIKRLSKVPFVTERLCCGLCIAIKSKTLISWSILAFDYLMPFAMPLIMCDNICRLYLCLHTTGEEDKAKVIVSFSQKKKGLGRNFFPSVSSRFCSSSSVSWLRLQFETERQCLVNNSTSQITHFSCNLPRVTKSQPFSIFARWFQFMTY